jgi:hypothetical protein
MIPLQRRAEERELRRQQMTGFYSFIISQRKKSLKRNIHCLRNNGIATANADF